MKYKKSDTVNVFGKAFNVTAIHKKGFTGLEYDLEAVLLDKVTGNYERQYRIPEGFINRC